MFTPVAGTEQFTDGALRYRLTYRHALATQLASTPELRLLAGHEARARVEQLLRQDPSRRAEVLRFAEQLPGLSAAPDAWIYGEDAPLMRLLDELERAGGSVVVLADHSPLVQLPLVPVEEIWQPVEEAVPEPRPSHYIEFEVLDQHDEPVGRLPFELTFPDGTTIKSGTLDGRGYGFVDDVPEGQYQLRFPDGRTEQPEHHKGWLKLALTDDAGQPMPGVAYTVSGNGVTREGTLDADGQAFVAGIPEGDYEVRFDAPGGEEA